MTMEVLVPHDYGVLIVTVVSVPHDYGVLVPHGYGVLMAMGVLVPHIYGVPSSLWLWESWYPMAMGF